jgi:hypothetical protein
VVNPIEAHLMKCHMGGPIGQPIDITTNSLLASKA